MSSTHYIAEIKITRVDITEEHNKINKINKRMVTDMSQITIKSRNMEVLIDKAKAHIDLVEDHGIVDPRIGSQR